MSLDEVSLLKSLARCKIKLAQFECAADFVADVRVKEQRHTTHSKVTVPVPLPVGRVDLRVSPEITHTLYVHHDHLMAGPLKREMTERRIIR